MKFVILKEEGGRWEGISSFLYRQVKRDPCVEASEECTGMINTPSSGEASIQ